MDFRTEVVMSIEISYWHFSSPVKIHIHSTITDQHTLEVKFTTFNDAIRILDDQFSQSR